MLRHASRALATMSEQLTSVARTGRSLRRLDAEIAGEVDFHHMLSLDWRRPDEFIDGIAVHAENVGVPDVVIAWIHDDDLTLRLASILASRERRVQFLHVIGSARINPMTIADPILEEAERRHFADYRQVVLGARRVGRATEWLTDSEISTGVIDALSRAERQVLVGSVEGW